MSHFSAPQIRAGGAAVDPHALSRSASDCRRCGICCKKGGPTFHREDKPLIEKGIISIGHLYTVREGEFARDDLQGGIFPVASDLIKIKGEKESFRCIFLSEKDNRCMIYEDRPIECRILTCRDTTEIESIYGKRLLMRKHLIARSSALWELVAAHQRLCSYKTVHRCLDQLVQGNRKRETLEELAGLVRIDDKMRETAIEMEKADPASLDLFFGRPLHETLKPFGLRM